MDTLRLGTARRNEDNADFKVLDNPIMRGGEDGLALDLAFHKTLDTWGVTRVTQSCVLTAGGEASPSCAPGDAQKSTPP